MDFTSNQSETQEAGTESWVKFLWNLVFTHYVVFAFVFILLGWTCCVRIKRNRKIKVLCTAGDHDYKAAFEFFIERNLQRKLKWINNKTGRLKGKYVLLCDLKNRLPEEVDGVLFDLGITLKEEVADILVVAMRGESGGNETAFNCIGTEDYRLHNLPITNIFYYQSCPSSDAVNDKAKTVIKSFFSLN